MDNKANLQTASVLEAKEAHTANAPVADQVAPPWEYLAQDSSLTEAPVITTDISAQEYQISGQTSAAEGSTDSRYSLAEAETREFTTTTQVKTCKYCNETKPLSAMQGLTCKNCAYHRRQRRRALLLLECGMCGKEKPGTAFRPDKPICRECESGDVSMDVIGNTCPCCQADMTSFLEFHMKRHTDSSETLMNDFRERALEHIRELQRRLVALGGKIIDTIEEI